MAWALMSTGQVMLLDNALLEAEPSTFGLAALERPHRCQGWSLVLLSQKVAFWELGIPDNFGRFVFRHEELRWITQ